MTVPSIEQAAGEAGSDGLANLLRVSLNDNGSLQPAAVQNALGGSLPLLDPRASIYGFTPLPQFPDGTDVTARLTAAYNYAISSGEWGGVLIPASTVANPWIISAALPLVSTISWKGLGGRARGSVIMQAVGTADWFFAQGGSAQKYVNIEGIYCRADSNTGSGGSIGTNTSNLGGIKFLGCFMSRLFDVEVSGTNNDAILIQGLGIASSGDAMHNVLDQVDIFNLQAGNAIRLAPASGGGSHPDGTKIFDTFINSAVGTGLKIDPPSADSAGYLSADGVQCYGLSMQQVPTPLDVCTQNLRIVGGRWELTGSPGTQMTIYARNTTPTNFPCQNIVIDGTVIPTHGTLADLVISDASVDGITWVNAGVAGSLLKNRVPVKLFDSLASGSVASFDITGIPAGFGHLLVMARLRSDRAATVDSVNLRFNGDSAGNYDQETSPWSGGTAEENAAALGQGQIVALRCPGASAPGNVFGQMRFEVLGYDDGSNNKTALGSGHWKEGTGAATNIISGTFGGDWRSNSKITEITLLPNSGTHFVAGSRVIVYGMP